MMGSIIAIDPGRDKCGVAILSEDGTFAEDVIKTDTLCAWVSESRRKYSDAPFAAGDRCETFGYPTVYAWGM
jgi:hypothetical protein